MLYYLLEVLDALYDIPGFGMVRYLTFRAAAAAISALVIAFWLGPKIIRRLRERQIGEAAKLEAPKTHLVKAGTPTMGGLIVLAAVLVPTLLWGDLRNAYVLLILFVTATLGVVGFLDDYLKVVRKKPKGLIGRYKIVGQVMVGLVVGGIIYFAPDLIDPDLWKINTSTTIPFFKNTEFDFGVLYIPMVVFVITATSNAVNLTDGLDGLAIGITGIVALTLGVISYISGNAVLSEYLTIPFLRGNGELVIFCAALAGGALGFLWFNAYPAQVFMGDTGSLSLGGTLGVVAVLLKRELLLVVIGGLFVAEALSVMIQVTSFKLTRRRVFKMAPLHHHFELSGWHENKVVVRFWIVGALLVLLSLSTLKLQ